MERAIKVISIFLINFLFLTLSAHADFRFEVRIVQFQPTDAPPEKVDILGLVKDTQEFYRNEMQRHDYGPKTFRVEKFAGKFRVHSVNGKHSSAHYATGTWDKLQKELAAELMRSNNIYIIAINGLENMEIKQEITSGVAQSYHCGASGGELFLAGSSPHLDLSILVRGLGIAFGIRSNISDPKSIMMHNAVIEEQDTLSDYEARWLEKSPYFNPPHPIDSVPEMQAVHPIIVGKDKIRIRVDLASRNALHQAIAIRNWEEVIGWDFLSGTEDTAHFQIEKMLLKDVRSIEMLVMDIKGLNCVYQVKVDLAASVNAKEKKLISWAKIKK